MDETAQVARLPVSGHQVSAHDSPGHPEDGETRVVRAVVVPHAHWDREWYAPFETMRFHLVRFFDELIEVLESDPNLPVFLLDGQTVILEDYLEVRRDQRERVVRLVRAGRMRPGPSYVQPDEFHVCGEALIRNLLIGTQMAAEYGWVMREGYLPDTFGHVHQLPQILRGFGIETFYAMRGFGQHPDELGSQFWWEGPDGSRVLTEWLTESYSNAAVLAPTSAEMVLHHGALVRYDTLAELLGRMAPRASSRVLLLLNGGDHLRVQAGAPGLVDSLGADLDVDIRMGGLEDFHALLDAGPQPETVITGELRYGRTHAVFDGIASTRTPLKALNERTESHLTGVAERLDALATLVDGQSCLDSLRHAWRQLVKNYAHDSICGCSVDEVHEEMVTRMTMIGQTTAAVAEDALARIAAAVAPVVDGEIPIVVVNPSGFARTGPVSADVLPDLDAPVGVRRFGWLQGAGVDLGGYRLLDPEGRYVPHRWTPQSRLYVGDTLDRRKELLLDRVSFTADDVPPLGTAVYRLVPADGTGEPSPPPDHGSGTGSAPILDNGVLRVEVEPGGTLAITDLRSGVRLAGLLDLVDDGDAGDEYGYDPLPGDAPLSATVGESVVDLGPDGVLRVRRRMPVPRGLTPDRARRSGEEVDIVVEAALHLAPGDDILIVDLTVDNPAEDHRLRLCLPTGIRTGDTVAESAFGTVRRNGTLPDATGWQDLPSGVFPMRRFVAVEQDGAGLQVLAEGLHEYSSTSDGVLLVTLLRCVGWMARVDHSLRPHKIGPEIVTPGAQCPGRHQFRCALRPFSGEDGAGHLYRAAERFSVPLQAWSRWDRQVAAAETTGTRLGLELGPQEVVLSAVKTAEDRGGLVVRFFNSSDEPVTATLRPAFPVAWASQCDLEEIHRSDLTVESDGSLRVPLGPAQIATVLLGALPGTSATDAKEWTRHDDSIR